MGGDMEESCMTCKYMQYTGCVNYCSKHNKIIKGTELNLKNCDDGYTPTTKKRAKARAQGVADYRQISML